MPPIQIAGDESGDFSFSDKAGGSRYFIATTVTMTENLIEHRLLNLRRELMWSGVGLGNGFHAYNDNSAVRRAVLREIAASGVRIDSTIIPKARVGANLRRSNLRLWRFAWLMHLQRVVPRVARRDDDLMVVVASIRTQMRAGAVDTAFARDRRASAGAAERRAHRERQHRHGRAGRRLLRMGNPTKVGTRAISERTARSGV